RLVGALTLGAHGEHAVLELHRDPVLGDARKIERVHVVHAGLPDVESRNPASLARAVPLAERAEQPAHLVLERGHLAERIEANQRCHLYHPPSRTDYLASI